MSLGLGQILVVLILVLILFGAGKLPNVMGDLGKGLRKFKEGLKGEGEGDVSINPPEKIITAKAEEVDSDVKEKSDKV